nr:proline-rich protein HaeIII subfamily 1-like [Cherax quadricarinatus]
MTIDKTDCNTTFLPSGSEPLGGFDDPVPSDGFEPDHPVGGPAPFTIPELSAPAYFPDFGPQVPRPPSAPKSPVVCNLPASHGEIPVPTPPPMLLADTRQEDNKPVRRPKRQRNRKPKRRPGRPPQGGRPQKQLGQWRPQRESIEDSPIALGAIRGGNGIRGIGRLREGGVTGFMKSFRRLIQRMI